MIRTIIPADMDSVLELVIASGMFAPDDLEEIRNRLTGYFESGDESPWNLLMLLVRHDRQGQGHGAALVAHVEQLLTQAQARLLLVETSGTEGFESAQRFYGKCGFTAVARIPDFYDGGDDKVIFTKSL